MKVILAVDSIFPPLTGIGRYAVELARGLEQSDEIESLRFFAHSRFVARPDALPAQTPPSTREDGLKQTGKATPVEDTPLATTSFEKRPRQATAREVPVPLAARARARLARSPAVVAVYAALMPRLAQWRLRPLRDHLFHGPNFILPPFAGPSVATLHDLSTVRYPEFHPAARVALMERAMPDAVERASALITPSEAIRREVIEHFGVREDRVHSIPMGVDARYAPREDTALAARLRSLDLTPGAYTLCIATLEPRKNVAGLLEAFQQLPQPLRRRYPLVLAGSRGWHSEDLYRTIRRLSHSGEVRSLGYVPEDLLPDLHAGARLFAFPSLYEGFGLPVLEAMASGVPVVTSDCSSLPEVAADAALLVDPRDVDAIAKALERGLEDEPWRAAASALGLARAAELSWPRCVGATLELYRSITA